MFLNINGVNAMILRSERDLHQWKFFCNACQEEILETRNVVLVREVCALPEETLFFIMHRSCADTFVIEHHTNWETYPLASLDAAWFLPLIPLSYHVFEETV